MKAVVVVSGITVYMTDTFFGRQLGEIEDKISKLGVPYTILRLSYFAENHWGLKDSIIGQSSIYSPIDPTKPFSVIATEDAGKAAAAILVDPTKHANKTYDLASDQQTLDEVTEGFSKALGIEVKYIRVPYDSDKQEFLDKGFPEWQLDGLFDFFRMVDSGSMPLANLSAFSQITGEQPTDLKAWLAKYSGGFQ